jgi:hypothetical protein
VSFARDRWTLTLAARYAIASAELALGTVDARVVDGGPSIAYRIVGTERLALRGGASLEGAWISGKGEGANAHSASGYGLAAAMQMELTWSVSTHARIALGLEAGSLGPGLDLRAGTRIALRASGVFTDSHLDFGFAF